ncbi:MAG TPA: hypothetical protein VF457_14005 [Burkholderiaceae bacterium]
MNPNDALRAAHTLGFSLPSPAYIFGSLLFGLVGLAAWRYGKVAERPVIRWLGVALMFYPYLVGRTWLLYTVGVLLCGAIWYLRPGRD